MKTMKDHLGRKDQEIVKRDQTGKASTQDRLNQSENPARVDRVC